MLEKAVISFAGRGEGNASPHTRAARFFPAPSSKFRARAR